MQQVRDPEGDAIAEQSVQHGEAPCSRQRLGNSHAATAPESARCLQVNSSERSDVVAGRALRSATDLNSPESFTKCRCGGPARTVGTAAAVFAGPDLDAFLGLGAATLCSQQREKTLFIGKRGSSSAIPRFPLSKIAVALACAVPCLKMVGLP